MNVSLCIDKHFSIELCVFVHSFHRKHKTLIFYLSRVVPKFSFIVKEMYPWYGYVLYVFLYLYPEQNIFRNHAIIHDTERNICNLEKFLFFRCWLDINLIYDVQHLTSFRRIFWHSFCFCLCETASYLHRTVTWEKFVYIFSQRNDKTHSTLNGIWLYTF